MTAEGCGGLIFVAVVELGNDFRTWSSSCCWSAGLLSNLLPLLILKVVGMTVDAVGMTAGTVGMTTGPVRNDGFRSCCRGFLGWKTTGHVTNSFKFCCFLRSRIIVNMFVFCMPQSRFASVIFFCIWGPLLSRKHLTVSLYFWSSGNKAQRKVEGPYRVQDWDDGVARRIAGTFTLIRHRHRFAIRANQWFWTNSKLEKNRVLVARPGRRSGCRGWQEPGLEMTGVCPVRSWWESCWPNLQNPGCQVEKSAVKMTLMNLMTLVTPRMKGILKDLVRNSSDH